MIRTIIFDFDGLIVDTETAWFHALQEAVWQQGLSLPFDLFVQCIACLSYLLYCAEHDLKCAIASSSSKRWITDWLKQLNTSASI